MTRKTHNLRRALLKRLLIATISTGLLFAQLVSPANALVSEGETVKGIQNFDIAVNGSSYDFFDLGSLCVEIDGSPLNKFGVDSVTLGGVKFYNFGVSSDFDLSSSGCTHRLWMVEDVESFESVQFRLNTALLSNGDHEVKITIRNDSDTCSGTCIPDAETFFTFSSLNSGSSGPVIYFNSELFNCADCLAIGLPYNLTATFGVSSLGEPVKVSSHLKVKGTWQKYFPAVYKNKKWVLSSITVWGPTWLEVKAQFKNGKSWYYKQLLKPRYRFAVSGPSEVRVGRSATS
ncbi:MAG: hypothetical protein EBT26_10125, partial [Microbacteriaceae bacterium]|nr:hypothetical protein [Microbacteriaceae bacterium]